MTKLKTRQRLMVRVSGTAGMAVVMERGGLFFRLRLIRRPVAVGDIATVVVAKELFSGEPVIVVTSLRTSFFNPEEIRGMLDLLLGRLVDERGAVIQVGFHGDGWVVTRNQFSSASGFLLRAAWRTRRIFW